MQLSARHVGEIVRELAPLTAGARIREVQAHPPRDLLLILEPRPGEPIRRLRFSADPRAPRLALQTGPLQRHKGPEGPFYRAAHPHLEGTLIQALEQVEGDRVVRLSVQGEESGDAGAPGRADRRALVLELFGRNANLLLVDDGGALVAALAVPRPGSAAEERLRLGAIWAPPAGAPPRDPGPALVDSLPAPLETPGSRDLRELAPLSWRIEAALGRDADGRREVEERKKLLQRIERKRKSARHLLAGLEERARGCAEAERLRMDAELLSAHRGELRRGLRFVELVDAFDPEESTRRIDLDPSLSPQKNIEKRFSRYRKLVRMSERLPEELELARSNLAHVETLLERVADPTEDPAALEAEGVQTGVLRPRQETPAKRKRVVPRRPYNTFHGLRGTEIRVGRTARDNDELTFKSSKGSDLWLHTSDSPGSHVVLVLDRGKEPDPEELLDAAHLAIHFSPLRGTRRADVHVARCKEVKKPKRAPAGLVTLAGGTTRTIRVQKERLERLLDTRPGPRTETTPTD